jgi:UDP-N-acetylglucosamine 4,6-dehydratase
MKGEKIFITGGAGFLGRNLIKRLYKDNEITVYSRDEAKHYYLKKQYPKVNFIIGDIKDREDLIRHSRYHSIGIFAASLKQIEACNDNYIQASHTIIDGAFNSRIAAEENKFKAACFISSDKSRAATTLYGAMKYVAGESFINKNQYKNCRLTTAIYGNVTNSTGSIIPLIWEFIESGRSLQLYGLEMTRFLLDVEEAIDLIIHALNFNGYNVIPIIKSFKIKDLFDIYSEEYGLKYEVTTPRVGEKIHEIMASSEELRRMKYSGNNYYFMDPKEEFNEVNMDNNEYSSRDNCITKEELFNYLKNKKFYKK